MTHTHSPNSPGRRVVPFAILGLLIVLSAVAAVSSFGYQPSSGVVGPEGVIVTNDPNLAAASAPVSGAPVDGITCSKSSNEVVKYHVHVYVSVYVNGQPMRLPAGIGITKPYLNEHLTSGDFVDVGLYDCLYWLHTHVADDVIHVEAPHQATFTLGQFFDIWGQPLSSSQVGPAKGSVVIFSNGRRLAGDPRNAVLPPNGVLQIDVGSPVVPYQPVTFHVTGLCGAGTKSCAVATK